MLKTEDDMELDLIRDLAKQDFTLGKLYLGGVVIAFTVEDTLREVLGQPVVKWKVPGKTAIPEGRYQIVMTQSTRFKRIMPLLLNVPGFQGIRIHSGNTAEDTEGCIILGLKRTAIGVANSREACARFENRVNQTIADGKNIWINVEGTIKNV